MTEKQERAKNTPDQVWSEELHELRALLSRIRVDAKYASEQLGHFNDKRRALDALERIREATNRFTATQ